MTGALPLAIFPAPASVPPPHDDTRRELFDRFPALELASRRAVASPGEAQWRGPDALSAGIIPLWTPENLIFVFEVRQPQACNRAPAGQLWSRDSLEFYLDCREERDDICRGNAWHIILAPPEESLAPEGRAELADGRPLPSGMRFELSRTATGWRGTLTLPAAAAGKEAFRAGDRLYWGVQLIDTARFRRNRNPFTPVLCLRFPCRDGLHNHFTLLPEWVLRDGDPAAATGMDLTHTVNAEIPLFCRCEEFSGTIRPTPAVARRFRSWHLTLTDSSGRNYESKGDSCTLTADWPHCAPGRASWVLTLLDAAGRKFGAASGKTVFYDAVRVRKLCSAALEQVRADRKSVV